MFLNDLINWKIFKKLHNIFNQFDLAYEFIIEVMNNVVYLINVSTSIIVKFLTLFELIIKHMVNDSCMWIFGHMVYPIVAKKYYQFIYLLQKVSFY